MPIIPERNTRLVLFLFLVLFLEYTHKGSAGFATHDETWSVIGRAAQHDFARGLVRWHELT
jgi:hypothetical protein